MNADGFNFERDVRLKDALNEFRSSARASAERPEAFWADQRLKVLDRAQERRKPISFRPVLAWCTTVVLVLVVVTFWLESPRALPAPDFAAGYDQDLLADVESLTNRPVTLALEPALILADEIAAGIGKDHAR